GRGWILDQCWPRQALVPCERLAAQQAGIPPSLSVKNLDRTRRCCRQLRLGEQRQLLEGCGSAKAKGHELDWLCRFAAEEIDALMGIGKPLVHVGRAQILQLQ